MTKFEGIFECPLAQGKVSQGQVAIEKHAPQKLWRMSVRVVVSASVVVRTSVHVCLRLCQKEASDSEKRLCTSIQERPTPLPTCKV